MRNLTVSIPADTYRQARIWAAQHDTSISAVVKYLLETVHCIKRAARNYPDPYQKPVCPTPALSENPSNPE